VSFVVEPTGIAGVQVVRRKRIGDARGYLERLFCAGDLADVMGNRSIMQINRTRTVGRGTVRGMHFQYSPAAETKFVTCLSGELFDVAVDLRAGSSTYGRWHGEVLSAAQPTTLVIPEGAAHGFQVLSDECELLYLHTASYDPANESGVNACDPLLAINWPLPVGLRSDRDQGLPRLGDQFYGIPV
jgi:dTDP-4-dehydrorhamnose 3,5-epimerase